MITNKFLSLGLRQTFQRRKILEFLMNTDSHPTAYNIYKRIVKDIPTVSKTTIYNTVNKLVKERIIKCIKMKNSEMRFDANTEPHCHFVCSKCGRIYDVKICYKNILKHAIDGHKVEDVFICYSGVCKACKSDNKKG
ncbi:MAG: transcriptional repressor [Endomicrobium sp.]|jgi:Fe2+ or Zn2+ uptake regulation protein|nr:transcriptional repressor [Endomicrobium sp.]